METIDMTRDIAHQVRFYGGIRSFFVEEETEPGCEPFKALDVEICGDTVSLTIYVDSDEDQQSSIILKREHIKPLSEYLAAIASL